MAYFKDQTEFKIQLETKPKRIISLVPSQTELLYHLGLNEEVIGITKFCIHPEEWFRTKKRVGGTKKLNLEVIRSLQPDLILANKEENTKDEIELLRKEFSVWVSDIQTLQEALEMIEAIGAMTQKKEEAVLLINEIKEKNKALLPKKTKVLYLIWHKPIMAAGTDTFINNMLQIAGFENALTSLRYPTLEENDLDSLEVDHVFLSSEPFPFRDKHLEFYQQKFPNATVNLVDGELFSWYGSRLLKSFDYFRMLNEQF